ncbi:MAG: valine--tRNA ligase [Lachnospiraceae bacterium]|nr:valine--tRNA ligase [Lachnospiraceae bacterium]
MRKELASTYDPRQIEDRIYRNWEEKKYFHAEVDHTRKPFTIVIPPPNITGQLHMGHALDNTLQDILIRFRRMQGYNALWQPGTDHASIATEVKVIDAIKEEGLTKADLGREKFLERCWDWRKEYGGRIVKQLKKLGSSCDWDRERFTMDEGSNRAVNTSFIRMYKKGWIYKGNRIINWCPVCRTSISDAEVEYEEQNGHFWHIKYPLIEEDGSISTTSFLEFATTRPETMLGDTAVAVNPEDERYASLVGRKVYLPFVERNIPVIADEYVDMEFGTGVVKITPAHDPNDFEVGLRHDLPQINILNDDATINENGAQFAGLDRYECRRQIVEELDKMGLLVGIEDYSHNVGTHDRCGATVEPMIKEQWFVRMNELIKPAVKAVKEKEIRLIPQRMEKVYFNWTDNIKDWCISRQLWWGHRIPAYTCDCCGDLVVSETAPETCEKCGSSSFTQDPDTLDTWFSSALWPFSTLGWPDDTEELKYFYPTDVLVTGYDIIFFWVIRMIFSGYEQMGEKPFHTVFFHGLVRDSLGRKMSKSLGNGIDPLEIIEQYGADALRMTLVTGNAPGNDMRFYMERVEANRNFANKIWNASRFILMNMGDDAGEDEDDFPVQELAPEDKWILSLYNDVVRDVTDNMERFELGIAVSKVYDFVWGEFCDWYIEMVKSRLYGNGGERTKQAALWTLKKVLIGSLKLLHPYMPFITEEIFCTIQDKEPSIMISDWPVYDERYSFPKEEESIGMLKEAVRGVRVLRNDRQVPPSRKARVIVTSPDSNVLNVFDEGKGFFMNLAFASDLLLLDADKADEIPEGAATVILPFCKLYIPMEELIDLEAETARLRKEEQRLSKELERSRGMLSNEKFLSKAPASKIEEEKRKQDDYLVQMEGVRAQLEQLEKLSAGV